MLGNTQRNEIVVNASTKRVAVLGGGIGGLASAHFLLKAGFTPVVLEASDRLGGLGTWFEHQGVHLDRYYHVILDSDAELCGLVQERSQASGARPGMGFRLGGKLYGFNSPLDLLRFRALSFPDRIRTGLGAAYITKIKKHGLDLDEVYACDWLRKIFGPKIYARIWEPLLRAKFGDRIDTVPAYCGTRSTARRTASKR
jgi:protoporphyrinogen oxidase